MLLKQHFIKRIVCVTCCVSAVVFSAQLLAGKGGGKPGGDPPPAAEFSIVYREIDSGALFLSSVDGSARVQITDTKRGGPGAAADESPTYSPSGDRIAFFRRPDRRYVHSDLYLINADGSNETFVAALNPPPIDMNSQKEDTITWSGNELEIIYSNSHSIHAVELSTGKIRLLADFFAAFEFPVDDVDISWVRNEMAFHFLGDIWRIPITYGENGLVEPLDLSRMIAITDDGGNVRDQHPRFSPDGNYVAFQRNFEELVVQEIATGLEVIVIPSSFSSEITWSPSGSEIAFRETFVLDQAGNKNVDILVVDVTTGFVTNITSTEQMLEEQPDWRPDPALTLGL